MKWFIIFSFVFAMSFAEANVSTEEVDKMLQQMVSENVISAEEAEKSKIKMKSMTPEQWAQLNQKAHTVAVARGPASVDSTQSIAEVKYIDVEGGQFKAIQDDIKKIMPDMHK